MLQDYESDFGQVRGEQLSPELRTQVSTILTGAKSKSHSFSSDDIAKIVAYIAQLEEALVDEDVHAVDDTFVLDKLKATTGFDVRKEAYTLENMRAEDM